ncbi:conserved hypothetical protein [Vibrio chagasii]|uniref:SEC-C metal-binding domain-containing protein n=1 Tax=Vibrio splendidus TaxID=29497 RepID=UPI000CF4DE42|nr:SEC-C metal-binding domain-containing protein [Vibrio splendidus]CAH7217730.1 conserved hypothetical protein [Vibrio chagasii]PQJ48582.1 hypothetical protein BTO12_24450 [Vibrio splendidus]CAH7219159.1 conserved hypothetical protein [Vibrio chagasii]CAH7243444.1 conserved hypothetical protein [Vibrio chagasii]CAH7358365.1 conserved hypothetical protein [Vibrio chagasii]
MSIEPTDDSLVRFFDEDIYRVYEEAKELYLDVPVFALLKARHINTLLIDREICRTEALKPSLRKASDTYKKINALKSVENYPSLIIELLHQIRKSSNRAAHLEKNELLHDEFVKLARDTLKQICDVIALLNNKLNHSEPTKYTFIENTLPLLKDLLYLAIVEKDALAKVKAGKILSECWYLEIENNSQKKQKLINNKGFQFDNYQRELAYTLFYSAAFEDNDLEGMYYLAFLIEHQWIHNTDSLNWSEVMLKAAKLGHEKAKRFWSYRTLVCRNGNYNSESSSDEQKLALSYVLEAASEHRTYQMLLSRLYRDGHLIKEDHEMAERYLKLAAENGESIAQYQYANVCFNNGEIDKANDLILLSGQSGYKPALSKVLKNNDISYEDRVDAYQHFLMIDHRDGEWDTMEHNTDIEITYAELVIEQGDTDKFAHASLLISNFLQSYMMSLSDDKFVHYLQLLKKALNDAKPTFQELENHVVVLAMLNVYFAEYDKRKQAFLVKKNEKLDQQQVAVKKLLSSVHGAKVGRNEPCPCGSSLKYKNCCR